MDERLSRAACTYCEKPIEARSLCQMHYRRLLRRQDLTAPPRFGGVVKYQMAHYRVKMMWGSASQYPCVGCGVVAREWAYDGSDPGERLDTVNGFKLRYSIHPEFYKPLCVSCHRNEDIERRGGRGRRCSLENCGRPVHAKGFCNSHYTMRKRKGMLANY